MPILVTPKNGPLSQGDLLKEIYFHTTGTDGSPNATDGFGLVLSRDCVSLRSEKIIVAFVKEYKFNKPEEDISIKTFRRYFQAIRDGAETPNFFYLGNIPGKEKRYCACLDQIFTIEVPKEGSSRREWIDKHRVSRLDEQFIRALPVRLFNAYAKIGYDDLKWFPDVDLDWFISFVEKSLKEIEAELAKKKSNLQKAKAVEPDKTKKIDGLKDNINTLEKKAKEKENILKEYQEEKTRRQ